MSSSRLGTLAIIAIYATVMVCTNHIYTILDDESTIIAVAGHPILPTIGLFLSGGHQHEHPPVSDILLHLWLIATGFSFFMLRVFANIFFIAGVFFPPDRRGNLRENQHIGPPSSWGSSGLLPFNTAASPAGIAFPCSLYRS